MDESLIEYFSKNNKKQYSPLAYRLRANKLEDIVGQDELLSKNKLLYKMIYNDSISSIIFYGPTGCGKTTIANVIANTTKSNFVEINASNSSKKELEDVISYAKSQKSLYNKKTILFIDEIHRFNKSQQDYLLPFVEDGTITLIGATTENPYFEVNNALLSRSRIFEFKKLTEQNISTLIDRALSDSENGLAALKVKIDDDAKLFLSNYANGDARPALNSIELASRITNRSKDGYIHITLDIAKDCIGNHSVYYDKDGDNHYDVISAFIKSMRGSDPQATIYYLARMLSAGEDIKFIARRIMICASEDVGLADPMAIVVATNCALAVERVGLPESNLILSEAALYVANAKKSNAVTIAIEKATECVKETGNLQIPNYLRDSHFSGSEKLNRGIGYKYPHNYQNHYVEQQYLPDKIKNEKFYKED